VHERQSSAAIKVNSCFYSSLMQRDVTAKRDEAPAARPGRFWEAIMLSQRQPRRSRVNLSDMSFRYEQH